MINPILSRPGQDAIMDFAYGANWRDERKRIIQSNDVAGIVIDVMREKTPQMFPILDLRYGIADALWDAGYRKAES